jgi:hypothetical protein
MVKGKGIGIDKLDQIIIEVRALNITPDEAIAEEMLRRVKMFNYVPTARSKDYGEALLNEYRQGG